MSFVSILFNRPESTQIGGFVLDVTISESHERTASVTDSPVEGGAMIQDHIINDPERIRIDGFVTETPAVIFGGLDTRRGSTDAGAVVDAFDELEELWRARQPLDVVTGYRLYTDMVITALDLPRNRERALRFSVEIQHVEIIEAEARDVPEEALEPGPEGATRDAAAERRDVGSQTTASEPEESGSRERGSSILVDFGRRVGVIQ